MSEDNYDELWELKWIQIPKVSYLMKYKFYEDHYIFMATDLSILYGETLDEEEVEERFCSANPYAEMKPKVILKHIKQTIKSILDGEESKMKLVGQSGNLVIRLRFTVSQVYFFFDLKPVILPSEKFRAHVIAPTVFTSLYIDQENTILKKKLEDMEKKETSIPSNRKYQEDPKIRSLYSNVVNKSKVQVQDVLQSYLCMQKTINLFLSENKTVQNDMKPPDQLFASSKHLPDASSSPMKVSVKEENMSLKFEDSEENLTTVQANSSQKREIENEGDLDMNVKPEIVARNVPIKDEDSNSSSASSLVHEQCNTKTKRKKTFKF